MNTPVIIRDGKAHPITAAQWALARAHKPIGPVAGLTAPHPPVAIVAPNTPTPEPAKPNGRDLARADMLARIGRKYGEDARKDAETVATAAFRRSGVGPQVAVGSDRDITPPSPAQARGADGLTMGQRSMLKIVEAKHGKAARAQAEARLGMRAT